MTRLVSRKPIWTGLGLAALVWSTSACEWIIGIPPGEFTVRDAGLSPRPDAGSGLDAGEARHAVRGMAVGVLAPLDVRLDHPDGFEILRVEGDGSFAFEARLASGASYSVTLVDEPTCVVAGGAGTVNGADAAVEVACEAVLLTALSISGPAAPPLPFEPARTDYDAEVPLIQQSTQVVATAASPDASIRILGAPAASGVPSAPLALALGEEDIDVVVRHTSGAERTYHVRVSRGADVVQYAYAKASNTGAGDRYGWSVALSGDLLAVGAKYEDSAAQGVGGNQGSDAAEHSGAVYVFRRDGTSWVQEAYLKASNAEGYDEFGHAVALWGDTLVVSAPGESSGSAGVGGDQADNGQRESGAVYVFRRTGMAWHQEAYLKASNAEARDEFGWCVALWGDTLAVGAPEEDSDARSADGDQVNNDAPNSGAVYVFRRTGTVWAQEAYLKASNTGSADELGVSVALWGDVLAVGAYQEDSAATGVGGQQDDEAADDSGAVYVFRRAGDAWRQEAYLKASNTGAGDFFGFQVALSGDTLAVGAPLEDGSATGVDGAQDDAVSDSGAVYVFAYADDAWHQEAYLKASNTGVGDQFGHNLSLAGDLLAIGAPREDSLAVGTGGEQGNGTTDSGAAYLFQRAEGAWSQRAYVKAGNTGAGDRFGWSLALGADTLAVGALFEASAATGVNGNGDDDSLPESGAVYVFH